MSQQSQTAHLESQQTEFRQGLWFALAAYGLWGLTPVYFKQLEGITPFEVLTHRVLWSVVFVAVLVILSRKLPAVIAIIRQPKLLLGLICTAGIISINWLTFIWAIGENRILETSLGYFMNPLVSIFLGMIFLSERLRPLQWLALSLAGLGVAYQLILHGSLPWVALVLAFSFGFYGLLRKKIPVDAISGLLIETVIMLPAALIYLFWLAKAGELGFAHISLRVDLLLVAAGLVTSLPLLFFAASAKRLSLTMIGFMQYLAPSITFALAVTLYGETLDSSKLITFSLIWLALILFSLEGFWFQKKKPVCS